MPDALDHLLAGHATSDAEYAAGAYFQALQHIIDSNSSDPMDLGVFSKPATFFGLVDDELRRLGVNADLLLSDRLFSGPPPEIPFHIPYPVDGPHIGMFPLAKAKPAADAYREVLERMDESFHYDVQDLIDKHGSVPHLGCASRPTVRRRGDQRARRALFERSRSFMPGAVSMANRVTVEVFLPPTGVTARWMAARSSVGGTGGVRFDIADKPS
ncbi:hypothetical protein [Streptomyces sp. NPDC047043]|uniref:DUF7691 family protein n=1 Tax=Streptomyces sp. NPDC047043 TaxID=3154497 RepID=UPI00340D599B